MSAHIVMPARRSNVPGEWYRRCTAEGCPWIEYRRDRNELDELARAHHVRPDGSDPA